MAEGAEIIAEARKGGNTESIMELIEAELSERIIGCCIKVHRALGPGFLEKVYEESLALELSKVGLQVQRQKLVVVYYDSTPVGEHRLDFLIESRVVLELKACRDIEDIHLATARSYLKATGCSLALVVNFARPKVEVRRVVLTT